MLKKDYFLNLPSYIDTLRQTVLPIFIYGMGDGCLKLLDIFKRYSIPCAGIFASDEFVRDKVFEGHKIHRLSEIESAVDDFIIALAFGAGYQSLIQKIDSLYSRRRLIVPDMPVVGGGLFTKEYMLEHFDELSKVYSLLADEQSRLVYRSLIEYKITGDIKVLKACESKPDEAYSLLDLGENEVYSDLGAYTGDTIAEFIYHTQGRYSKIYAVEPNARNFRKLSENTHGLENIVLKNAAVGDHDGTITVTKGGGRMIRKAQSGVDIPLIKLDTLLNGEKCTYIKYDVEGSEAEAISGSEFSIKMYRPKLNVALYHRTEDIFSIPLYINSLLPESRLFIRHFPYYPAWDTNLYVLP